MSANNEVPRPKVIHRCRMCGVTEDDVDGNRVIVSPSGTAHYGLDGVSTKCGRAATGYRWWWPAELPDQARS